MEQSGSNQHRVSNLQLGSQVSLSAMPEALFRTPTVRWMRSRARQCYDVAYTSCVREFWEWARCSRGTHPSIKQLVESLSLLSGASDQAIDIEAPIFVLSTGWRTGSTLLQRILVTDPGLLLWGEPFGDMAILSTVADMLSRTSKLPSVREHCIGDAFAPSTMATSWIALLFPPVEDFRLALRSLFDRWLAEPARQRGFARWGFKEVRLSATEATLLFWLYPKAKFLILSRHPYDCYRSFSGARWRDVKSSAAEFAGHWNRLATSWSELPVGFPSLQIKYEDLVSGKFDFRKLESWLGVEISETVAFAASLGHTAGRDRLSWHERFIISHEAARGMRALGYPK